MIPYHTSIKEYRTLGRHVTTGEGFQRIELFKRTIGERQPARTIVIEESITRIIECHFSEAICGEQQNIIVLFD